MSEHLNKKLILGVDIGGTHISAALVDAATGEIVDDSVRRGEVDASGDADKILDQWTQTLKAALEAVNGSELTGIGIAMPGPFDYKQGVSLIRGLSKYDELYGMNIKSELKKHLDIATEMPVCFENDAACFGLGETLAADTRHLNKIIAITLGTGLGATFLEGQKVLKSGAGVPPNGEIYDLPFLEGMAEDYISSRWLIANYNQRSSRFVASGHAIAERAYQKDEIAVRIFEEFGEYLGDCLAPWIKDFQAECIVIGGSIAKSANLFQPSFESVLKKHGLHPMIKISTQMEFSAMKGAAAIVAEFNTHVWRKSSQPLMPAQVDESSFVPGKYHIYPTYKIGSGLIFSGFDTLGEWILTRKNVMIDGFAGNDWTEIRNHLNTFFEMKKVKTQWYETKTYQKTSGEIDKLIQPYIGEKGDVWGKKADIELSDFFDIERLSTLSPEKNFSVNIIIGTGAAYANWNSLVYFELPKNEIQYRMRAGQPVSLTDTEALANAEIYKRLYFVDWVVNNKHRNKIQDRINVIADAQWRDRVNWTEAKNIYQGFAEMSSSVIRARPWFEAGAWGGQWLKNHIPELDQDEINYAWSFELIVPENGLVFESDGKLLEVPFDWLMERQSKQILGADEKTFGAEFPIRFDYLDTVEGGNLSIQCHPSKTYIRQEFGENFTQDETYYILDCKPDATVYLGFQDDINPAGFRTVLEESAEKKIPVDVTKYVQRFPAKKHDLFLIPNQTIHSAGKNNLVLEISATPYIFTFKMYDWVRLDLEGNPRPINIEHAMKNLDFSRKGKKVVDELISKPIVIEESPDHRIVHLPTHPEHFYDVHRLEFSSSYSLETQNKCFVMMLVEGESLQVTVKGKAPVRLNYAETFVIPAAAGQIQLVNEGAQEAKVIKAFIK